MAFPIPWRPHRLCLGFRRRRRQRRRRRGTRRRGGWRGSAVAGARAIAAAGGTSVLPRGLQQRWGDFYLVGGSMDWFKGKSTGNHGFYHQIWGFPVNFPIIQFYEWYTYPSEKYESQLGLLFPIDGKITFMFQTTNQGWYLQCFLGNKGLWMVYGR